MWCLRTIPYLMTTIAVDRTAMAGDLQCTNSRTGTKWKCKTKIYKFDAHPSIYPEPFIVGFSGSTADMIGVSEFFSNPDRWKRGPTTKNIMGLVLVPDGTIYLFEDYTSWILVDQPYAAIGTGAEYALGAMVQGATPKQAVRASMKHDIYTGMGVKELHF